MSSSTQILVLHDDRATARGTLRAKLADPLVLRGAASLVDQAMVSGCNFLTTLLIGRMCLPEELGLYTLGFSLIVALMKVPKALIWQPYTTFLPAMSPDQRRKFTGSALVQQIALGGLLGLVVFAIGMSLTPDADMHGLDAMLRVLGPAMALIFLRECVRQLCFAELRMGQVVAVDGAMVALQTAGIASLAFAGELTATRAYLVIIAATIPVILGWTWFNRRSIDVQAQRIVPDFTGNYQFARWLLASAVAQGVWWLIDPWALSLMHGTSAAGVYSAAQSIILLANPLVISFGNFFGPHAAHVYAAAGAAQLYQLVLRTSMVVTVCAGAFTGFLAIWGGDVLVFLFGDSYAGQGNLVTALMVGEICEMISLPTTMGLLALGRGNVVLAANVFRLLISGTVGLGMIYQFGPMGVGYSRLASSVGAAIWQWISLRNVLHELLETPEILA